jgi:hypothetical protein
MGGSSVQTIRLFHAHRLAESWITWVLYGLLFCNAMGLMLARVERIFRLNLLAILCGGLALVGSLIGSENGSIWVREGLPLADTPGESAKEKVHSSTDFVAESHSGGGVKRIELPFRLRCGPEEEKGIPCAVESEDPRQTVLHLPTPGEGVIQLMGYNLAFIGARPTGPLLDADNQVSNNSWLRLGKSRTGPLLKPEEVLELSRGNNQKKLKLGSVQGPGGATILIARGDKTFIGLDSRLGQGTLKERTVEAPLSIERVQTPRWLKLSFQRPSPNPLGAILFHLGPWLLLLSIVSAAMGLFLNGSEET